MPLISDYIRKECAIHDDMECTTLNQQGIRHWNREKQTFDGVECTKEATFPQKSEKVVIIEKNFQL